MGLLQPDLPEVDLETWRREPFAERIKPMARHVAEVGFGTPDVVYVVYLLKIGLYLLGAWLFALSSPGVDGFWSVDQWWTEPIVFQKLVLWSMLFEVLGLGCGFGPLNNRFSPPVGSFLYWLRPGTIRLPPWPGRVPLSGGTTRGPVDLALYAGLLVALVWALLDDGSRPAGLSGAEAGLLPVVDVVAVLLLLGLVGLRDKTIFLAARAEVYGALTLAFLFTGADLVLLAKLVMLLIWWGAAVSKLNRHFPYVVATMESNSPLWRLRAVKRRFHRRFPDDLQPSRLSAALAFGGSAIELGVPLVLVLSDGGLVTTVAVAVMIAFHLHILLSIPMGVPLEWNVYMILALPVLFGHHAGVGFGDAEHLGAVLLLLVPSVVAVVLGNVAPRTVSFLPGMRYYAGNWDTTVWCMTDSALEKVERHVKRAAPLPQQMLERFYGREGAEVPQYIGYAWRCMYAHGRALYTLVPRACGPDRERYLAMDGEVLGGNVLGWNFGCGHLHMEQLVAALQERCAFEPGEVRVVMLDGQPIQRQSQDYRLVDAAVGELERGRVLVADMVARQPWELDVPLHVQWSRLDGEQAGRDGT